MKVDKADCNGYLTTILDGTKCCTKNGIPIDLRSDDGKSVLAIKKWVAGHGFDDKAKHGVMGTTNSPRTTPVFAESNKHTHFVTRVSCSSPPSLDALCLKMCVMPRGSKKRYQATAASICKFTLLHIH